VLTAENLRYTDGIRDDVASGKAAKRLHHDQMNVHEISVVQAVMDIEFSTRSPNSIDGLDAITIVGYSTR